jgi:hypothetical protein
MVAVQPSSCAASSITGRADSGMCTVKLIMVEPL